MKAIIVDDEPRAIALLKGYLSHFKSIELAGTFRNGLKAFEYLSKEKVELIFLDINMPHISGISLSKMIGEDVKIIFTTAYSEYAVESYEVQAVDYLLKPISLERFTKAISKVLAGYQDKPAPGNTKLILVKSGSKTYRLNPDDIEYIEKEGNYSTYYVNDQKIVARASIHEVLSTLPVSFMQVHKSFIVNSNKVSSIGKDVLHIQGRDIPIGASFKKEVMERLLG